MAFNRSLTSAIAYSDELKAQTVEELDSTRDLTFAQLSVRDGGGVGWMGILFHLDVPTYPALPSIATH